MKYIAILLVCLSLYSCSGSRRATKITYEWDTLRVKKPVLLSIEADSLRLWDLDLIQIRDTTFRSGRAKARFMPGRTPGKINAHIDCMADTVLKEVSVEVPVYLPSEIDCLPDETIIRAKRSQGRTEGAAAVILIVLLLYILKKYLKTLSRSWLP